MTQDLEPGELVRLFGLSPHPEGGYYRETYRAAGSIPLSALPGFTGERSFSTAIYFLLPAGASSRLHRIRSDELWHFYLGGPLTIVQLWPSGKAEKAVLGPDVRAGHRLQHAVAAGCWFGALPAPGAAYCFVGCTVAPGFDFADLELGRREELLRLFPAAREAVELLARD